jgi:hypothetical protein
MLLRFRSVVLVCLIATVFAAPALTLTARASLEAPSWSVGDYWAYKFTGSAAPVPGTTGTLRYDVLGTESVTVAGTSYTAYRAKLEFNVTSGSTTLSMPGNGWFRTSDLSPVKMTFTATVGSTSVTVTLTYNPPVEIRWPLTANAQWSATSILTTVTEISGQTPTTTTATVSQTLRVEADEQKTVSAGTFTVTPVIQTQAGGNYAKSYWSRDAGNTVEEKSYDSTDTQQGGMELKSYRHVAPSSAGGPATIMGLPPVGWAVILLAIIIVVLAAVVVRRRRPQVPAGFPPAVPPTMMQQVPTEPPPQPPATPPQEPGGPYPPPP